MTVLYVHSSVGDLIFMIFKLFYLPALISRKAVARQHHGKIPMKSIRVEIHRRNQELCALHTNECAHTQPHVCIDCTHVCTA